jgi:hypothetical protein
VGAPVREHPVDGGPDIEEGPEQGGRGDERKDDGPEAGHARNGKEVEGLGPEGEVVKHRPPVGSRTSRGGNCRLHRASEDDFRHWKCSRSVSAEETGNRLHDRGHTYLFQLKEE